MQYFLIKIFLLNLFLLVCFEKNQLITYDLKNITPQENSKLMKYNFDVEILIDSRDSFEYNENVLHGDKKTPIGDAFYCVNSEQYYKESVTEQISKMIVAHLSAEKLFKNIYFNNKDSVDIYLTGNLHSFYGKQEYPDQISNEINVPMYQKMLIKKTKTKGEIKIIIDHILLHFKDGTVKPLKDVTRISRGDLPADADCYTIFTAVNQKLKNIISDLSLELQDAIE